MPAELKGKLVAEIHRSLPAELGFKKSRHRLIRELPDLVESVDIQGSAWNSAGKPWKFYVNIRVWFPGVPSRLGAHVAHAECRLEALAPDMPPHFDVTPGNLLVVAATVARGCAEASRVLPGLVAEARRSAEQGLYSRLAVPREAGRED